MAKTATAPWKPQQAPIKYGLSEAQRLYDLPADQQPQYYPGKTLAGFAPAEQRAQRAITGYAMGPETQALQAGATANLQNVYKLGQGLPGLGQAYAQPAQRIAEGLPGLGEKYAGAAMGYAGGAGDIASGLPALGRRYADPAQAMAGRAMGFGSAVGQPLSQTGYSQLTPFQSDQYQQLLSGEVDVSHLTPVIEAMGRDVQGQLDPILASLRQGTVMNQPGGGTRGDLAAGTATAGLMQGFQDQAARMYADAYRSAQDRRLSAAQLGIGQQQFGMGYGLQGGQLGLGAGDLATRSAQQAGQLGLGAGGLAAQAGGLATQAARAGGELGLGAGGLATRAAQMGGQLGLGGLDRYQGIMDQPLSMYGAAGKVGEQQRSMEQEQINRAMAKQSFEQNQAQNQLNQYLSQVGGSWGSENVSKPGMMNQMGNLMMMYKLMGM